MQFRTLDLQNENIAAVCILFRDSNRNHSNSNICVFNIPTDDGYGKRLVKRLCAISLTIHMICADELFPIFVDRTNLNDIVE